MRISCGLLLASTLALPLSAQTVALEPVVSGLTNPVDIAHCGDERIFIVERPGVIKVLQPTGQVLPTPFLDISGPVNSGGGEQGLLGLAFHPQYAQNGFFYLYYCTGSGNGAVRVSRFSVSNDPNVANAGSETVLWELSQPFANHKGGDIDFGPDGYLYFAPGDGGDGGDPGNRAQNMALGFGKVHRIDVNASLPYGIPPTNPFADANNADTLRTIFASGLRNPFRFGFDALNGDLWIGDVGQSVKEEIDRIPGGQVNGPNFGWRCYEGTQAFNTSGCTGAYAAPVIDHPHSEGFCSIIGGRVYRGSTYPSLAGRYIYTDYCHGRILSLRPDGLGGWINETLMTAGATFGIACIAADVAGELYVVNTESGVISRMYDPAAVVRIAPKVFLDGPFNTTTGLMRDQLRIAGLIPTTEPYTALGYPRVATGGGEALVASQLTATGNAAVVDWVRIELRSASHPQLVRAVRHGLLRANGDITTANGLVGVPFTVGPGNYFVVVRHRNHLGAMTAVPIALTGTTSVVDFRSGTALFGSNAMKPVNSVRALWAGNTLADGAVKYIGVGNDRDPLLTAIGGTTPNNSVAGYRIEDVNLDGVTKYTGSGNDRDPILVNVGGTTPNSALVQQLP